MNVEQRLEVLCQIMRDYDLVKHMWNHRHEFEGVVGKGHEVGADLALVNAIVNGEGLFPVQYEMAHRRAASRLGLMPETERP